MTLWGDGPGLSSLERPRAAGKKSGWCVFGRSDRQGSSDMFCPSGLFYGEDRPPRVSPTRYGS